MGRQQDLVEAALERDASVQKLMGIDGPIDTSRRIFVQVLDVDGKVLPDVAVPFGIKDPLGFGVLMVERHRTEFEIVSAQEHTDSTEPMIIVTERQAS